MPPEPKHITIVTDTFFPDRNSASVQLYDLSNEFSNDGYKITVIIPSFVQKEDIVISYMNNVRIVRIKSLPTKDINYFRRAINEFVMPFIMFKKLKKSSIISEKIDGVIWYSPSIFHGPIVKKLKKINNCKGYLILRDIFPEWAYDMGLMGKGAPYFFFKRISDYQYSIADIIGVQSPGNLHYFDKWKINSKRKLEVLNNWLSKEDGKLGSISLQETKLAGRKIFVYAGNMGVAQGMEVIMNLVLKLRENSSIGFVFVGRGSEANRLEKMAFQEDLQNVLFFNEIDPNELSELYKQCHAGIVALDSRHKSHNIPGKFISYIKHGLPVLANVNLGNDLAEIIRKEKIGYVCESNDMDNLLELTLQLLFELENNSEINQRCEKLFLKSFTSKNAMNQIVDSLF